MKNHENGSQIYISEGSRQSMEEKLRESEERFNSLITAMEEIAVLLDRQGTVLAFNRGAEEFFGFKRGANLKEISFSAGWEYYQEDGTRFSAEAFPCSIIFQTSMPCKNMVIGIRKPGQRLRWFSANGVPLFREGAQDCYAALITLLDITGVKEQERLIWGVAEACSLLVTADDDTAAIGQALKIIGESADLDCVYVYEEHLDPKTGKKVISDRFDWLRGMERAQKDAHGFQNLPWEGSELERWRRILSSGGIINTAVRDLPPAERKRLESDAILSVIMVPIFVGGEFWGFVGCDDCYSDQRWDKNEEAALRALAASIGGIIKRKRDEKDLRIAVEVFENITEAVAVMDRDGRIFSVNPAFGLITGYSREEVNGKKSRLFIDFTRHDEGFYNDILKSLQEKGKWQGEIWLKHKYRDAFAARAGISALKGDCGLPERCVIIFNDITTHKEYEEQIKYQAFHDALTGLPNRYLLQDRLSIAIGNAKRYGQKVVLMLMDLDGLKIINDNYGHDVGDILLQVVGQRLQNCVRKGDTVARVGGDEFILLFADVKQKQDIVYIARKILAVIREPVRINRRQFYVSASIGISIYPEDGEDEQILMKKADIALYQAKKRGKDDCVFYSEI